MGESKMDKKPLMGVCIGAVVLLVLGSLSNVVGYQSVKSSAVNDSPLFQTRTQRATNQQQNILTTRYLGKELNALPFPLRNNRTVMIQKFIDGVRTMDNATFNRFIEFAINLINHKDNLKDVNVKKFIIDLRQLRKSTENIRVYKDKNDYNLNYLHNHITSEGWVCALIEYLFMLLFLILFGWSIPSTVSVSGCCMLLLG
jgi:hypothetical protein